MNGRFANTRPNHLAGFPYPKFSLFVLSVALAYAAFGLLDAGAAVKAAGATYTSAFVAGALYSFGFTSPFAAGAFIYFDPPLREVLRMAVVAGIGGVLADLSILKFVRFSLDGEFARLRETRAYKFLSRKLFNPLPTVVRQHLLLLLASIIIASPLPDEIGVALLAGLTKVKEAQFALFSFVLSTLGALVLLLL